MTCDASIGFVGVTVMECLVVLKERLVMIGRAIASFARRMCSFIRFGDEDVVYLIRNSTFAIPHSTFHPSPFQPSPFALMERPTI